MNSQFRLEMLGKLSVLHGNRDIRRFRTQKTAALLAYLALYKQRAHPRDALIELFWPDSALEAARTNLSVALNALRRLLEAPGIPAGAIVLADRANVRLNPDAFTTDVEEFTALLNSANQESETIQRIALRTRALDLYQGGLLPGFYEDWILAEQDRLRAKYHGALEHIINDCADLGQHERAIEYAHRLIQSDPLRESAYHHLMRLCAAIERPDEALHHYDALTAVLRKELDSAPSAPLRELADTLRKTARRHQTPASIRSASSDTVSAAPKTPSPSAAVTAEPGVSDGARSMGQVPLQFTRFFGRDAEMAQVTNWLNAQSPDSGQSENKKIVTPLPPSALTPRLITLTGPGGMGKTRLSIEIASEIARQRIGGFPGDLWFVPLGDLHDPLHLGETMRDALELPRQIQPTALEQVIDYLNRRDKPLLILDNFEQIAAGGAQVVWTLLNRVPRLRCLVTSRQTLALPGERELPLPPLATPGEEAFQDAPEALLARLLTFPSIALFVDRAQDARPDFQITPRNAQAVAGICAALEGIPLAIELAAVRCAMLTPGQILERLAQRFDILASRRADKGDRHHSLWTTIDWSYGLLAPEQQRLFARLSVFRGGWSLEAAEAVCGTPAILERLAQLRSNSLLRADESTNALRFQMLETLREFARAQQTPEERSETEWQHAVYFHQWVEGAHLAGSEQLAWYERFEEDLDNLRAVLEWSLQSRGHINVGLDLASTLLVFWRMRGHLSEGRRWLARLLEQAPDNPPTMGMSRSLYTAGSLASMTGDFAAATPLLERSREAALAIGDENGVTLAENEMGSNAYRQGDYAQARRQFETVLSRARLNGTPERIAGALTNLASAAQVTGDYAVSQELNTESLALWREIGDRIGEARTLHNLANLALSQKQWESAQIHFAQSLEIKRSLGDHYGISSSLAGIAEVAKAQGDYVTAARYVRESLGLAKNHHIRTVYLDTLHSLTELARIGGHHQAAAQMYGALERAREAGNYPLAPADRNEYEQIQTELKTALGAAGYESARTLGTEMPLEQALELLEAAMSRLGPSPK